MTDRPILFPGPMIRALIEGRKTQARPVLKRLTRFGPITEFGQSDTEGYDWHFRDKEMRWHDLRHDELMKSLPYAIGDRLWVRETFQIATFTDVIYQATPTETIGHFYPEDGPWRPSTSMSRQDSRLTLTVTDIRIQKLQDITYVSACAEGCDYRPSMSPRQGFHMIWTRFNGPDSWNENPWVIALTFDVIQQNIDDTEIF